MVYQLIILQGNFIPHKQSLSVCPYISELLFSRWTGNDKTLRSCRIQTEDVHVGGYKLF